MKSKTLYFDKALAKSDARRFAPLYVAYAVVLALMAASCSAMRNEFSMLQSWINQIGGAAVVNLIYCFVLALLLYGDLYSARQCYSIHALPITRGGYFFTKAVMGLAMVLVPTVAVGAAFAPFQGIASGVAGLWILAGLLQGLCFFGLSVLCIHCAGNVLGALIAYGGSNLLATLVAWLGHSLYAPLLLGVRFPEDDVLRFSPIYTYTNETAIRAKWVTVREGEDVWREVFTGIELENVWGWYGAYAAVGVVLLAAALLLFRRRKLEACGDLLAFDWVKTLFSMLFPLGCGSVLQMLFFDALPVGYAWIVGLLGMAAGWVVGQLILRRQLRGLKLRSALPAAGVAVLLALIALLTYLDVLGIGDRIPAMEEIQGVTINGNYGFARMMEEPQDIAEVRQFHSKVLEKYHAGTLKQQPDEFYAADYYEPFVRTVIEYSLKNGGTLTRVYDVARDSEEGDLTEKLQSKPEVVVGMSEQELLALAGNTEKMELECYGADRTTYTQILPEDIPGMIQAILADSRTGHLAQAWMYHSEECGQKRSDGLYIFRSDWEGKQFDMPRVVGFEIFDCCEHVQSFLQSHGYHEPHEAYEPDVLEPMVRG